MLYILVWILSVLAVGIYMLFRNNAVRDECLRVIRAMAILADRDIANRRPWKWRYDAFDEISYESMLFQFWRPVKSFYRDHPCLEERHLEEIQ